jgi:hypothetical protein
MRLKTKLVLAITTLVFLISGLLSLVYVFNCSHSAVQQSYETNRMVANQVQLAVRNALETGLSDRKVDPNNPAELRNLAAEAVRNNARCRRWLNRSTATRSRCTTSTSATASPSRCSAPIPTTKTSRCPQRPTTSNCSTPTPIQLMKQVFGPPKVFEVVVPAGAQRRAVCHGARGRAHHVAARLLCARLQVRLLTLMGFVLGTALLVAFLLSNLALRPMEQISLQLDLLNGPSETAVEEEKTGAGTWRQRLPQD